MKIKKTLALLLAATMSVVCMVGCGQEAANGTESKTQESTVEKSESTVESATEGEKSLFNETGFPIVNEEITIRILACSNTRTTAFSNMAESAGWKYISELTGIKFEFEEYSYADMVTKWPLIMADPDSMPDIFWRVNVNDDKTDAYIQQGLLLQLDEYIEKYGPNIQKCLDSNETYLSAAEYADGHIYSLPSYNENDVPRIFYVNNRWMENCGIDKYPTNLDEFKEMLIKFRDMDANGNGDPTDEIPLFGNYKRLSMIVENATGLLTSELYGPGVAYTSDPGSTETYPAFMDERYRYSVEYMTELYEEKLLEQDFLTVDSQEVNARRISDRYGVLYETVANAEGEFDPDEWTALAPLASKYVTEVDKAISMPSFYLNCGMINANTEYPEVCVRLLDYFYSPSGTAFQCYYNPADYDMEAAGVDTEVIKLLEEGFANPEYKNDGTMVDANVFGLYGCRWVEQFTPYKKTNTFANNMYKTKDENVKQVYLKTGNIYYVYTDSLKFNVEEAEVVGQYKTDMDIYIKDKHARWITGEEKLNDDTWNAYIKQLKAMHVDDLTKVYQNAVNRFYGVE